MVNHSLAAKLTANDLLLIRSLGRLFSYKKFNCLIEGGFKISVCVRQSSATSNTFWTCVILGGNLLYKDIFFLNPQWGSGPYISRNFVIRAHFVNASWKKNRTYARTFPVQSKEINVVKIRFTMRYFSRKLSHVKVRYNHSLQLLKTNYLFFPG